MLVAQYNGCPTLLVGDVLQDHALSGLPGGTGCASGAHADLERTGRCARLPVAAVVTTMVSDVSISKLPATVPVSLLIVCFCPSASYCGYSPCLSDY